MKEAKVKYRKEIFKPQYSGERSRRIWDTIGKLPRIKHDTLYASFVLLQNIEGTCLTWLNNALQED